MYKILSFWIFVVLILSGESDIINPVGKCTQPSGGYCVEIQDCPNIHQIVRLSPPPLRKAVAQIIRKHHCGFNGINPLVCCWYRMAQTTKLPDPQFKIAARPDDLFKHYVHIIFPPEDFDIDEAYP